MVALAIAAGCATPKDVRFTAAYTDVVPWMIGRFAVEATAGEGYVVVDAVQKLHFYSFITAPIRLDPADTVEVAFVVQTIFETESRGKKRFLVVVDPRPFEAGHQVGESRLPAGARQRARALSDAIRRQARGHEAPI